MRSPGRLDIIGAGILSASLLALLLAISEGSHWGWADIKTLGLLALGAAALVLFVLVELRVREPLINMRLMALRGVWATNLVGLTFGFAMYGSFLIIPTLLEMPTSTGYGFGKSVSEAGLFLLPSTVTMLVFGPLSGLFDRRYGPKAPLTIGAVLVTIGFALPGFAHSTAWQILLAGTFMGAGIGFAFAAMANAIIEAVPATHTGEATSVNSIVRSIGGSIGSAVVAAVIAAKTPLHGLPANSAFTFGFLACAGVALLATFASLALPAAHRRHTQALDIGVEDLPPEPRGLHLHLPHPHLPHPQPADD